MKSLVATLFGVNFAIATSTDALEAAQRKGFISAQSAGAPKAGRVLEDSLALVS